MNIEIWSDFACPYCYIGDTRLKSAISELDFKDEINISYRTYQLDPQAVRREPTDYCQLLATKYNKPYSEAKKQVEGMIESGKELGLNFNFDSVIRTNTTLAHRVSKLIRDRGQEELIVNGIFKAYFEEGLDISNLEALISLVDSLNINAEGLKEELEKDSSYLKIKEDYKDAAAMGVRSVPFFVIDNKYSISGAQNIDYFKSALTEIRNREL